MTIKLAIKLEQVWSITEAGWLMVETCPLGKPNNPVGAFTFDDETVIDSLEADIEIKKSDPTFEMEDWVYLKENLRDLADQIETKLNEELG